MTPDVPPGVRRLYAVYPAILLFFCAVCTAVGDGIAHPDHAAPLTMRAAEIVRFAMALWITFAGGLIEMLFARGGLGQGDPGRK